MKSILDKKRFIINDKGDKVGVLLDFSTYKRIETFYEDFVLGNKMDRAKKSKTYSLKEAAIKLKYSTN